jgi:SNF2 family DNA or RNA helicase
LINLNDIKGYSAITILKEYDGKNPYIKLLKKKLIKVGKINLTDTQSNYIIDNHKKEPILINKIVAITEYLGEELKKQEKLTFVPEKILIEYILADSDKTFHVYGKLKRNQEKSEMYFLPKTQVLDDPYFEEINIEVDFDKYEKLDKFKNMNGTVGRKVLDLQKDGIKFLLTKNGAILADEMGAGKGIITTALAITPNGLKCFGDLKVGDRIIGSNGKPCNITGVFPQGVKDIYKITFNDGYNIVTDGSHLWTVSTNNSGENSKNRENRYVTISTEQMLDENLVLKQKGTGWNEKRPYKFKTYYKEPNGNNKWQIPIVSPIHFENNDVLPIEPYLLGLSLGDGHFTKSSAIIIQLHKDDFDELFQNVLLTEYKSSDNKRIAHINYHSNDLKELKLENTRSDTKFIPDIYKYSSIENRLAILQGLMDTDGHCCKSKNNGFTGTEYCTVSERLANDVAEIVHSLGGIVRKSSKIGKYKKEDGTIVECKRAYRLNIKMPEQFNPFRLKRKADIYYTPKKYKVGRYIKNIEPCGQAETVCISVDAPDKLYVMEHGIVTHNTLQATVAALESGAKKILIVCPSSVKINWQREINYYQEFDIAIINGKEWKDAKFTIINYDILKNFHTIKTETNKEKYHLIENQHLLDSKFDLCIIDEAHNLKNKDSKRGAIMSDICKTIDKVWLLSGTPVANRPMDYFNLLKLIKSPLTENWKYFATRYCEGRQITTTLKNGFKKKVWLTNGASNLEELSIKTRNIFLRRLTEDFVDMPDRTVTPLINDLTKEQKKQYEQLWEDYLIERENNKKTVNIQRDLVELGLLRKYMAMETIPHTIELVDEIIEQGNKVVIFTCFTEELLALANHYGNKCVVHYGQLSDKEKQRSVDEFQNREDGPMVFIGNIISAGVGITLTRAHYVVFNSFDWVPGNSEQSEFRCFRIGQKNNVKIYYNLFNDTIITKMWHTLNYKKEIINKIIGGNKLSDNEIIDIMVNEILEEDEK